MHNWSINIVIAYCISLLSVTSVTVEGRCFQGLCATSSEPGQSCWGRCGCRYTCDSLVTVLWEQRVFLVSRNVWNRCGRNRSTKPHKGTCLEIDFPSSQRFTPWLSSGFNWAPGSSMPGTPSTEAAPAAAAEPPDICLCETGRWNVKAKKTFTTCQRHLHPVQRAERPTVVWLSEGRLQRIEWIWMDITT